MGNYLPLFRARRTYRQQERTTRNFQSILEGRDALVNVAYSNWEKQNIYRARNRRQLRAIEGFSPTIRSILNDFGFDILHPGYTVTGELHTHRDIDLPFPYLDITEAWWRLAGELQQPARNPTRYADIEIRMYFNTQGVISHMRLAGTGFPENERIVAPMQRSIYALFTTALFFFDWFPMDPFPPPRGYLTRIRDVIVRTYDLFWQAIENFYLRRVRLALEELLYNLSNSDPIPEIYPAVLCGP